MKTTIYYCEKYSNQFNCKSEKYEYEKASCGIVYILKINNGYKVGMTTNLKNRMSSLKSTLDKQLILIHKISSNKAILLERYMHEAFIDKRIQGEIFNLNDTDIEDIKRYDEIDIIKTNDADACDFNKMTRQKTIYDFKKFGQDNAIKYIKDKEWKSYNLLTGEPEGCIPRILIEAFAFKNIDLFTEFIAENCYNKHISSFPPISIFNNSECLNKLYKEKVRRQKEIFSIDGLFKDEKYYIKNDDDQFTT